LILKAHLIRKNPLDIEGNLRVLREFANHGRMGSGYSAVDMVLHDIAGKVYGVPAFGSIAKLRNEVGRLGISMPITPTNPFKGRQSRAS
jgi:L-alanine-DL-glutamate epimerase-like enolase superfamily enzyme